MDFLRIVRSLEEFLYEVMSWLVFYPKTMWRALRHPLEILRYSEREMSDKPDDQFTDLLSPPLFLMITILLSHSIEIASHQVLPAPSTSIGKELMASEQNLLILRSILFAIYPLMFAMRRLKRQKLPLDRETLRKPFFAQCYVAAPAALAMGIAAILARAHAVEAQLAGIILCLITIIWYVGVEATWLHRQTRVRMAPAIRSALGTWLAATLLNSAISVMVLGL
ncbi:hypothetical protein [Sphingomonas colocasiae]|uniref:Permease n=1 Tax=Sphingomonas colocasiae TaxID=1848973 RepID=A0ABS7PUG1_9SPHN|nr:hypothetical protein [Sphingomonas colocasiae]MBY8824995.1 hypothetical protein [Sphingomonas colocasiae]